MTLTLKRSYKSYGIPVSSGSDKVDYSNTAGLGIAVVISYLLIIFYSLFTAWKRLGNIGSSVLSKGKNSFTISQSIYYSEKTVTVMMSILFGVLCVYMLYRKNFIQADFDRLIVVIPLLILPLIFIIFLYIGPNQSLHYPLAASIFIGGTIIQYFILELYNEYFENDQVLKTYQSLVMTMIIFAILITICLMFSFYTMHKPKMFHKKIVRFLSDILALSEYVHLILYGILLYMFSTFAALPSV